MYDLFIGMDSTNVRSTLRIFGGAPDKKVHKLMGCTALLDIVLKQDKYKK